MTRSYCSRLVGFCVVSQISLDLFISVPRGHKLNENRNPENYAYGPCFLDEDDRWARIDQEESAKEARKASYDWDDMEDQDGDFYQEGDCSPVSFPPTAEELLEESRWQYDQEMEKRSRRKAA